MTPADIAEARAAIAPLATSGLLIAFPSLDFPGRDSLKVTELAPRLGISWSHLVDLLHEDGVAKLDLSFGSPVARPAPGQEAPHAPRKPKASLRIPLSAWRQWIATRYFATNGELPPPSAISTGHALAAHPELEPPFGTSVLSLKTVSLTWGCSYQHLANLWLDPLTRRFALLDLRSVSSLKPIWQMPVEEYRRATTAALTAGQKFHPTPRDGTARPRDGTDLPPSRHSDRPGQQPLFAAHG